MPERLGAMLTGIALVVTIIASAGLLYLDMSHRSHGAAADIGNFALRGAPLISRSYYACALMARLG
jgi:hypothetical protein